MKIWYEANDGEFFDNAWECELHELILIHTHLDKISFYTKKDNEYIEYHIDYTKDITCDDTYQHCDRIHIHDEYEFLDLIWLSKYCGWSEFTEQITQPGIWTRYEDKENSIGVWKRKR